MTKLAGGIGSLVLLLVLGCEQAPQTEGTPAEEAAPAEKAALAERGTLDEARAMLQKASDHYAAVGRTQALQDFTAKQPPFTDRDLYVFCFGPDRSTSAHGADAAQLGRASAELRDADGQAFATHMLDLAQKQPDGGEIEYKWRNPVNGVVERKISVFRKLGDDVCGVGAYQSDVASQ